jgi:hypothetical protein
LGEFLKTKKASFLQQGFKFIDQNKLTRAHYYFLAALNYDTADTVAYSQKYKPRETELPDNDSIKKMIAKIKTSLKFHTVRLLKNQLSQKLQKRPDKKKMLEIINTTGITLPKKKIMKNILTSRSYQKLKSAFVLAIFMSITALPVWAVYSALEHERAEAIRLEELLKLSFEKQGTVSILQLLECFSDERAFAKDLGKYFTIKNEPNTRITLKNLEMLKKKNVALKPINNTKVHELLAVIKSTIKDTTLREQARLLLEGILIDTQDKRYFAEMQQELAVAGNKKNINLTWAQWGPMTKQLRISEYYEPGQEKVKVTKIEKTVELQKEKKKEQLPKKIIKKKVIDPKLAEKRNQQKLLAKKKRREKAAENKRLLEQQATEKERLARQKEAERIARENNSRKSKNSETVSSPAPAEIQGNKKTIKIDMPVEEIIGSSVVQGDEDEFEE